MNAIETCAVCGRSILAGERTRTYLAPDGESHPVCELCRARAEHIGWVWEEVAGELPPSSPRRRRSGGLGGLLRGRGAAARPSSSEDTVAEEGEAEPEPGRATVGAEDGDGREERRRRRGSPDPAAPGAGVGRASVPDSPQTRLELAVSRFNGSEEARTVGGLMRTLGAPWISVGAAAGSPSEVRITVAWELSWYQWGVDLRDELRPVYQIAKGHELDELDAPARQWNASASEGGQLTLRRQPEYGDHPEAGPTAE